MDKTFPASIEHLHDMLECIRSCAKELKFSDDLLMKIELASEEALVNIISYAYNEGIGTIEIHCFPVDKGMKIVIEDTGMPFNPLIEAKEVDITLPMQQRALGGYGIFLLKQVMDEVSYQRQNNRNVLTLVKWHKGS